MNPKLLIVEDNELTSSLVSTIFSGFGFEVKEIARGDEVLPYLDNHSVDIIILDLELPGMNGDEIYAALKKNPKLKAIPVVPFTAQIGMESETSVTRKLTRSGVIHTGRIPDIVYKANPSGESPQEKNITADLIDAVSRALIKSACPIPQAMLDYYKGLDRIIPEEG